MLELTETMSPLKYRSQFFPLVRERRGNRDLHTLRGRVVLIDGIRHGSDEETQESRVTEKVTSSLNWRRVEGDFMEI